MSNFRVPKVIPKEIFRAYDIRGVVQDMLTPDTVYGIGSAIGTLVLEGGEKAVVVGRDGRLSGPLLNDALSEGILATGCDVVDIGMVPTPVLYYATHYLEIPSGVMITGSHNPKEYNGLKIMVGGKALHGEGILGLYAKLQNDHLPHAEAGTGEQTARVVVGSYIREIQDDIYLPKRLKIVVDCGNGVAGNLAPHLYEALGCEVIPLFCEVDGNFPNHHPDPGQPENLQDLIAAVKTHGADLGLAFDGDGDRLGMVDNTGKIIWPDRQLILFAKDIIAKHPQAKIIFDVKCTRHVSLMIEKMGGVPLMWKTGHSLIKAKIAESGALLAGEMSGHMFFNDRWYGFDDALYAGARLLEIVSKAKGLMTVADLFSLLPDSINTPELVLPVDEKSKFTNIEKLIQLAKFKDATISTIDGLRVDFKDGFGLVRPSNTGPNLILRFEGDTKEILLKIQEEFRKLLQAVEPNWVLPY